ncbi:Ribonuclease H domain [Sesbania bispinosa]|nr:Ribonuclease H domain [Sesbania bispinosa]
MNCQKRGSFTWNSVRKAAHELHDGFGLKIGNGHSNFWYSDWLNEGVLCEKVLIVDVHDVNLRICDIWNGSWHLNMLHTNLPSDCMNAILSKSLILSEEVPDVRNHICFEGMERCTKDIVPVILNSKRNIGNLLGDGSSMQAQETRWIHWVKPPLGHVALNVDGSSMGNPGMAGFGGLLRDCAGAWLQGFCGSVGVAEVLKVELLAILHGLNIAWRDGFKTLQCFSDSKLALSLLEQPPSCFHKYASIIAQIRNLIARDWRVSFHHVCCEDNQAADFLAKLGARSVEQLVEFIHPPQGLPELLFADENQISFARK